MASQYDEIAHSGNSDGPEAKGETSSDNLRARYPKLENLPDMDDEQKIEAFRDVLGTLNEDLNSQQRV
ncbi:hypothetical protein OZX67_05535 [Bifidobacterium sp. ESL0728]|uniref:hypothetical protein n=1 Tax=Bifidobacterium sp. ESL0728 TaxID=2983220 RepID=UPI0023F9FA12|nr:hypothetical protein [Bifidobacterium sp. ESL0728]WEV58297.1 hypothetical protein OZX67_05535 [Bifidobacterium sp. ESL0728]